MPGSDPPPGPDPSLKRGFWRIFRLLAALSMVIAMIAVILVSWGAGEVRASLIIATAVGVGFTMLLGSALMALMFLSSRSGHDEEATPRIRENDEE